MIYDVAIVGSGVAGVVLADRLLQKGLKVLVLEAGPDALTRNEYQQNFFNAPIKTPESPYVLHPEAPFPLTGDCSIYYDQEKETAFKSTYLKVAGGTTWHWLGTSLRFHPRDFRLRSLYGKGVDWPISYDDLEPWYEKAEVAFGVAGDNRYDLGSPRKNGYPKRPITLSYLDQKIAKTVEGMQFDEQELLVNINPQARDPDICMGSRSCIPLCPTGAKYEAAQQLKQLTQRGLELRTRSVVYSISIDKNQNISHLNYLSWDGKKHQVKAKFFVIAAHAIETAKILLQSSLGESGETVANSSDQVGRNLMDHPTQLSWAVAQEPIYPYRGPLSGAGIDTLRDGPFRQERAAMRVQINNDGWYWPRGEPSIIAEEFIQQGFWGTALKEKIKDHMSRHITLSTLVEQLPDAENRVRLSPLKDALGLPRPKIHYRLGSYEQKALMKAREVHELILNKMKTDQLKHGPGFESSDHVIGTVRMSETKKQGVVDKNLQCFDHQNLYLLGSGVFPTSGTANPTLTIAALALRLGAFILSTV